LNTTLEFDSFIVKLENKVFCMLWKNETKK
jgi:hypothetical protein